MKDLIASISAESRERGWLFTAVAAICAFVGGACLILASLVAIKGAFSASASAESIVRLFVIGVAISWATSAMWRYSVWGRNIAVAVVATVCWVVGESVSRHTGAGITAQFFTVLFVAMSLSCFTSARVRALFAAAAEEREAVKAERAR